MVIILMGVSGSGKTTIGRLLARRLGLPFYDGDDYHPVENVAKMSAGIPLTDADRAGWLENLARLVELQARAGESAVLACSALKQSYRDLLARPAPHQARFVYLKGSYEIILARMQARGAHFMKSEMLRSQFAALEEPQDVLTVDVTLPPEAIVEQIIARLA